MMKKMILSLLISFAFLLGCSATDDTGTAINQPVIIEKNEDTIEGKILIVQSDGVSLYAEQNVYYEGQYRDITIHTEQQTKTFPWFSTDHPNYTPRMELADINDDGKQEVIILLTTGHGTSVYTEEIHILNRDNLTEIPIENAIEATKEQTSSSITTNNESIHIVFEVNENKYDYTYKLTDAGLWFDHVAIGVMFYYTIENDRIKVSLSASVSPGTIIGDIIAEYDASLKVENISFKQTQTDY